jgi:hypothetical protein
MTMTRPLWARPRLLGVAAALAGAVAAIASPASASAACYASTPSSAAYADPIDGDSGLAPEITTVRAGVDAACNYVVDPGVAGPLIPGDAVFVYLDTDGNAATGSPLGGADVVVGTAGTASGPTPPIRGVWTGASFQFTDPGPVGAGVGNGGFSANVVALGVAPGALTQMIVASIWSGTYDDYIDVAPDAGRIALPVTYSTVAPAASSPPVTAPVAAPRKVTITPKRRQAAACTVPRTKGLTAARARTRLRAAGCTVADGTRRAYSAKVRRGRVVRTSVRAGARTKGSVRIIVSQGRRARRARASSASVRAQLTRLVALDQARLAEGSR